VFIEKKQPTQANREMVHGEFAAGTRFNEGSPPTVPVRSDI